MYVHSDLPADTDESAQNTTQAAVNHASGHRWSFKRFLCSCRPIVAPLHHEELTITTGYGHRIIECIMLSCMGDLGISAFDVYFVDLHAAQAPEQHANGIILTYISIMKHLPVMMPCLSSQQAWFAQLNDHSCALSPVLCEGKGRRLQTNQGAHHFIILKTYLAGFGLQPLVHKRFEVECLRTIVRCWL